ncbi:MAG: ABC-F type ribosomal protection protein [Lachnospiraceae bacterium]|jgi:lincosamide and streptogramin A transport system ATP-binding/permease protein|nr:ABC-F type ribosomal protection protein [Lachnospiraceae bacterium]
MAQISVVDLTFYYDGSYDNIFEDTTFQIDTDWKLGFIARNGRGKTTFLNLLRGKYEYEGTISAPVSFDYFPYDVAHRESDTIDVVADFDPDYEFWKVCRELNLLEVDTDVLYRPFQTLSNGEQTKVMLAVLFSRENNFLLIDEPTNHLDMASRALVMDYLNKKSGFILVSHDRSFMDGCVDHVLVINRSNIEVQKGNFSSWWENKRRQDNFEQEENERLKGDIKRLTAAAKKAGNWADQVEATKIGHRSMDREKSIDTRAYIGEKSRRMQQRRKNLEKRQEKEIEEKSRLLKNIETVDELKLLPKRHHKEVIVRMEDVTIAYDDEVVLNGYSMTIANGERVLLQGKNGSGKSSIIREIIGNHDHQASGLIISYVPQDASFLRGSIIDYGEEQGIDETVFMMLLRKLDFSRVQLERNMEELSGGQKKKILLAASLCTPAHLYVWDEPLNFIDVFSRMQIENLLLKFEPTVLMVEHDRVFVERIATRVISLKN